MRPVNVMKGRDWTARQSRAGGQIEGGAATAGGILHAKDSALRLPNKLSLVFGANGGGREYHCKIPETGWRRS